MKDKKQNKEQLIAIAKLIELLASIDTNSPDAELNEISMSDGKGGRIYF